ncbi:MAG TPA: hypothetical protein VIA18_28235 [Polyangia bacterium]|nr:hypothetical protein [Polyangia bacterium]
MKDPKFQERLDRALALTSSPAWQAAVTARVYRYLRVPNPKSRYWARRWNSMSAKKRASLMEGTQIERSVSVDELCAIMGLR